MKYFIFVIILTARWSAWIFKYIYDELHTLYRVSTLELRLKISWKLGRIFSWACLYSYSRWGKSNDNIPKNGGLLIMQEVDVNFVILNKTNYIALNLMSSFSVLPGFSLRHQLDWRCCTKEQRNVWRKRRNFRDHGITAQEKTTSEPIYDIFRVLIAF